MGPPLILPCPRQLLPIFCLFHLSLLLPCPCCMLLALGGWTVPSWGRGLGVTPQPSLPHGWGWECREEGRSRSCSGPGTTVSQDLHTGTATHQPDSQNPSSPPTGASSLSCPIPSHTTPSPSHRGSLLLCEQPQPKAISSQHTHSHPYRDRDAAVGL